MRLSEAMELGHILIGDAKMKFYDPVDNCGCALGSMYAAVTPLEERKFVAFDSIVKHLSIKFPVLSSNKNFLLMESTYARYVEMGGNYPSLANQISHLHCSGMPRLEIAKKLRELEDKGLISWVEDAPKEIQVVVEQTTHA